MDGFALRKFFYGVGGLLLASNAFSHGGDSSLIHACVDAQNVLIFSGPDLNCNAGESPVHWSIQGPPGPTDPILLGRISTLEAQVATLQMQIADLISPTLPDVFISDVTLTEGTTLDTFFDFTVSLTMPSLDTVVVNYSTADGTATGTSDYQSRTGQLIFLPGDSPKLVSVRVLRDTDVELDETFFLNLDSAFNANTAGAFGTGTIVNDDAVSVSISGPAAGLEGDLFTYDVTLSRSSPFNVSVDYTVVDGTATVADNDLTDTSGTLLFNPGQTTAQITVQTNADGILEDAENFSVSINNPVNATLSTMQVMSTLLDIDGFGNISITDASIIEGDDPAFKTMQMNIVLDSTSSSDVSVRYGQAIGGTASSHSFFNPNGDVRVIPFSACNADTAPSTCPTLVFSPGETQKTINVQIKGDTIVEGDENFFVRIFEPFGALIADDIAEGIIIDDD